MAFHIDSGEIDGVGVSDLSVGILGDTPGKMADGGWRVGVLMDEQASEEQAEITSPLAQVADFRKLGEYAPPLGDLLTKVRRRYLPLPRNWSRGSSRAVSWPAPSVPMRFAS